MLIIYSILTVCVVIAAIYDAATQKIPNGLSLILVISGLGWNVFSTEGLGLKASGAGLVAGLLLMLPGYVMGSMGAGDAKLMAAIGSVVGFNKALDVVLYSYWAMFAIAVVFVIVKGDLLKLLLRYKVLLVGLLAGKWSYQKPASSEAASYRLPLAPAIALATGYVLYPDLCHSGLMAKLCHF